MHKDIRLALQQAQHCASRCPRPPPRTTRWPRRRRIGYAHRDIAALHEVLDRLNPPARRDEPVGPMSDPAMTDPAATTATAPGPAAQREGPPGHPARRGRAAAQPAVSAR